MSRRKTDKSRVVCAAAVIVAACGLASAQPGPAHEELNQGSRRNESVLHSLDNAGVHDIDLKRATGTVAGRINNPFLRRHPAVLYIENVAGRQFTREGTRPVMDQKNLIFDPHLLPVLVGSTVDFPNSDTVRHNVFSPAKSAKPFNLGTYPAGEVKQVAFDQVGVVPLLCNVHAEMFAYVVVLQNSYFALTDKQGAATLSNVPVGEYILTFWHEDLKSITKHIKVSESNTTEVQFENLTRK